MTTPRVDLYTGVHKGLRAFLFDTYVRLQRLDVGDEVGITETMTQLRTVLRLCDLHLHDESEHIHPVLEARTEGATLHAEEHHDDQAIEALHLRALGDDVLIRRHGERARALQQLVRRYSRYVGGQLEHMSHEEEVLLPALHAAFTDDELRTMHHAIVSSIPPADMAVFLRWMFPAVSHPERVAMLSGMKVGPHAAFVGALSLACAHLPALEATRLLEALGLKEIPRAA